MIGIRVRTTDNTRDVLKAANRASFRNLGHAAATVRRTAMKSIKRSKEPSAEGEPPHTRRGRKLPRSIFFSAEKDGLSAIVGPVASRMGTAGAAHEFGGMFMGEDFPERPFMGPALEQEADRMPSYWSASIGQ